MKKYWMSLDEKNGKGNSSRKASGVHSQSIFDDLAEAFSTGGRATRRDFLKLYGFSLSAAALASCQGPVNKAIPFIIKPEEVTSGVPNYYASSFIDGSDYCSIVVKTREGRPIKIEGNPLSSISRGGTSARVQASVLSLYDTNRLQEPTHKGNPISWEEADGNISSLLSSFNAQGRHMAILVSSVISPSTRKLIGDFHKKYPTTRVVHYDPVSSAGIRLAHQRSFNKAIVPAYQFDKADLILSFGADFLGTWLDPVAFTKQYTRNRKLEGKTTISRHIQLETAMTLTGSNADRRIPMKPLEEGVLLVNLYNSLLKKSGKGTQAEAHPANLDMTPLAEELLQFKGRSLVVSGSNDVHNQVLVNSINVLLGNYGATIDMGSPLYYRQGEDQEMEELVRDMNEGIIDALILYHVNPVYDYHNPQAFQQGMARLKHSVALSVMPSETTELCHYVCPDHHYLESWNDAEPQKGVYSLCQPAIHPLFNTRASQESLLRWMGQETNYHDYIQAYWKENIFPYQTTYEKSEEGFRKFWTQSLHDGVFEIAGKDTDIFEAPDMVDEAAIKMAVEELGVQKSSKRSIELHIYENVAMGIGKFANNPWLQELPDPISKACWDNYACIPPSFAREMDLDNGDLIQISNGETRVEIPVLIQPGQAPNTISVAMGYGRMNAGKVGDGTGVNIFPFVQFRQGTYHFYNEGIKVSRTEGHRDLALTQTHGSMEGRAIVRETTLAEYLKDHSAGNEVHKKFTEESVTLYKEPLKMGYHWSLSIDLNSCTGCGNCIIACQAENNVPVIGREQVRKRRIMHWIRIDRYYSDSEDNPQVYHQPVMCQHCDNAPCENVCPVAATSHSDDGLNHMTYNRCIGTRYCMNNCPYKVRRFNWFQFFQNKEFDYYTNSDMGRMVLNPDVVVRSRGVAEKCSLCIQRIQDKKQQAKLENRRLLDDEIKPACLETCPGDALVFGNRNDEDSKISARFHDERNYGLLEEIHALPSVGYLVKVRNKLPEEVSNEQN